MVQDQNPLWLKPKRKSNTLVLLCLFGWGTGIRTPEVTESESVALPLGDAPKYYICLDDLCIISKRNRFVNSFFKNFLNLFALPYHYLPKNQAIFSAIRPKCLIFITKALKNQAKQRKKFPQFIISLHLHYFFVTFFTLNMVK